MNYVLTMQGNSLLVSLHFFKREVSEIRGENFFFEDWQRRFVNGEGIKLMDLVPVFRTAADIEFE